MTKEEALKTLIMLSALESWTFSVKIGIPEPYRQDMTDVCAVLTRIVLGESK